MPAHPTVGQDGVMGGSPDGDGRADTFYAAVGGEATFRRLVAAFYAGVAEDPLLRPLYPEQDLGPAAERLTLFLMQYWGGPSRYSQERGHPRLRMRHAPFPVDEAARDAWLRHMRAALDTLGLPAAQDQVLWDYLTSAADSPRHTIATHTAATTATMPIIVS
jgi:hemoglobin